MLCYFIGGLSTTAVIKVQVLDVNDNRPAFYPLEYNVSLPEGEIVSSAVVVIVATDDDSDIFGEISYEIIAGNDLGLFQIDHRSGNNNYNIFHHKKIPYSKSYFLYTR